MERVIAEYADDSPILPAESFFDVFVEVDLPDISGGDGPMPRPTGAGRPSDDGGLQPDFFLEDELDWLLEDLI